MNTRSVYPSRHGKRVRATATAATMALVVGASPAHPEQLRIGLMNVLSGPQAAASAHLH